MRFALLLCVWVSALLGGCALPALEGRSHSVRLSATESQSTALGQATRESAAQQPGLTGIYALADSHEAFAARMQLAQHAEKTLDVQYYIWKHDTTGQLLLDALHAAADRGVRVRLLLDDHGTHGLDTPLAQLDRHPNAEVRLFNPYALRTFKWLGLLTDFARLNRRMHNKSYTADNAVSIMGGRNVGDAYFGATEGVRFADLDLLVVGPVVDDVSASFDDYWASASAFPVNQLVNVPDALQNDGLPPVPPEAAPSPPAPVSAPIPAPVPTPAQTPTHAAEASQHDMNTRAFTQLLMAQRLPLIWAPSQLVVDAPSKVLGQATERELLTPHLARMMGEATRSLDLVSAYFVPTDAGTDYLVQRSQQGVRIRVLTNSLAATDVLPVHSGYARHRQRLLEAGVSLYELKPDPTRPPSASARMGFLTGSGSSLHAKTFGIDGRRIFIGTFNFDPRSVHLNTEMGFIIDSPTLMAQMTRLFESGVPDSSWRVARDAESGQLMWIDQSQQPPRIWTAEPMSSWLQRATTLFLGWLPLDWLL